MGKTEKTVSEVGNEVGTEVEKKLKRIPHKYGQEEEMLFIGIQMEDQV